MEQPMRHFGADYAAGSRSFSFGHQLNAILERRPASVLEIGPGPGVLTASLRRLGIPVTTLDVDPTVNPDIVAGVTAMPFDDARFDVSACFQVLEHLRFDRLERALLEINRVTRRAAVLSLPDVNRSVELTVRLPLLQRRTLSLSLPRIRPRDVPAERTQRMGHQWEIGYRGSSRPDVERRMTAAGWSVQRTWRVPEVPWHRFYALETTSRPATVPGRRPERPRSDWAALRVSAA